MNEKEQEKGLIVFLGVMMGIFLAITVFKFMYAKFFYNDFRCAFAKCQIFIK